MTRVLVWLVIFGKNSERPGSRSCRIWLVRRIKLQICCFFFFQAEDGIRDIGVTGVQTCALPIYGWEWQPDLLRLRAVLEAPQLAALRELVPPVTVTTDPVDQQLAALIAADDGPSQIGRASCRERV